MKKTIPSVSCKIRRCQLTALTTLTLLSPTLSFAYNESKPVVETVQQQGNRISGTITDKQGEPLIGATIMVVGSSKGTVTGIDGKFSLDVPQNTELKITSIGFATQNVRVKGSTLNIVMIEDRASLDEVVVLGYGAGQRKQDLSASVGVINNAEQLAIRPVNSTESMLQGQLAGVTVSSNGGDPTSTPSIVIRGQGSMNGDNVLWVVDGIPGAPIPSLNDIESVVVLKDAESAATMVHSLVQADVFLSQPKKRKKVQLA